MERYDIRQGEWRAEKAEAGDFVLYADAQATIATLQARVTELEAIKIPDDAFTYCAYCGEKSPVDEHNEDLSAHIKVCPKHPMRDVESQLTQRTAEFQRHDGELQQICGQALGYPWFKDDQKNFPGATEKDGVCVGEHVGITIAQELADAYRKHTSELEAANTLLYKKNCALGRAETSINDLQAELERVRADNKALDEWRADVTVSLQRPGGAFFVDVPQHIKDLVKERDDLRTLLLALPKVEGAVVVSNGYVKDSTRCHALFGADEDAALYAALLQERQKLC